MSKIDSRCILASHRLIVQFSGLVSAFGLIRASPILFSVIDFPVVRRFSTGGSSRSCPGSDRVKLFWGCLPGGGLSHLLNDSHTLALRI